MLRSILHECSDGVISARGTVFFFLVVEKSVGVFFLLVVWPVIL